PNSAYVDAAIHGDGLISLQFRDTAGGQTHEIQARPPSASRSPVLAGLERQGDVLFISLPGSEASPGAAWPPAGAFTRLKFTGPVYVGLGVCAHDDAALEKARFSQIELRQLESAPAAKPVLHCALETISIASKD